MSTPSQRVAIESCNVVIRHPKSLGTRCSECFHFYLDQCSSFIHFCRRHCCYFICFFLVASIVFITVGLMWVVTACHKQPGMALEAMRINDMLVYKNFSESPWQVNSEFNVDLATWNRNTVAGCYTTLRHVIVRVEYRGQVILRQEVPLGFGLKPRSASRTVSMKVRGGGFPLMNPNMGPVMEKELRNDNFSLEFFFDARYLRNDRKRGWASYGCQVVTKTPSNSSQPSANGVLTKYCLTF